MIVRKIGIDLGTCNTVVFIPKKGVVFKEPSIVAVSLPENKILAVGQEAKEMLGRTPDTIRIYRPLRDGVIADFRVTLAMIRYFLKKTLGFFSFLKPEVLIGVPVGATSTERRALIEAGLGAGAKEVFLVKEPILAAIGAGIPIESYSGNMVVDIGGGTTEVAVISLGGIVTSNSIRIGGDKMDLAISEYIKKKYNLAVGEQTAEEIKIKIGSAVFEKEPLDLEIKGRDLISGLPRNVKINSNEVCEAISDILSEIIQVIKSTLRETPAELSADIMEKGIVMTGGGSLLRNLPELFEKSIGIPIILAEEPMFCVAKGTGKILESLSLYKRVLMTKK
jgi:rod shape-determining protein MreB